MTTTDRPTAARLPGEAVDSQEVADDGEVADSCGEVADDGRTAILLALADGRAWTVGELACRAGIARDAADGRIRRLVGAGLVVEVGRGRRRYLTLARLAAGLAAGFAVAGAGRVVGPPPTATPGTHGRRVDDELAAGRTCYRHLAGRLGVGLADEWRAAELISAEWQLTDSGRNWFAGLGIDTAPDRPRPLLRPCIDWTERRPHAAGVLADRLAAAAFERGWVVRGKHPRSARPTADGDARLHPARSARPAGTGTSAARRRPAGADTDHAAVATIPVVG